MLYFSLRPNYAVGLFTNSFAQSPSKEKPTLKDFGSSLKKLKWDPETKQAVINEQGSREGTDDDVIRIETSLVTSDVLVTDRQGRPIRNLAATDFEVSEEGVPQQVGHFVLGNNTSLPRSIVLIIDYSRSQFPYIADSIEAAKGFVDKLGPYDRMAIVTDDVELLVDFTQQQTRVTKGTGLTAGQNSWQGRLSWRRWEAAEIWSQRAIQCLDGHAE